MKVLITGTHFTPAQAVIEELSKNYPDFKIVYVGRKTTMEGDKTPSVESKVLSNLRIKFVPIIAGRLSKVFEIETFFSLFKIPIGFIQAFFIVLLEKPDVLLSFGGYVGFPLVFASWLLSVPSVLHEQTLVSGLANTMSSLFADKIAVSFNKEYPFPKEKMVITGNPIRAQVLNEDNLSLEYQKIIKHSKDTNLPIILVTGGNQGAHIINKVVEKILDKLLKIACVIHQTGDSKFKDYERLSQIKYEGYLVKKWIEAKDLGGILRESDLVISRAGANTLIELSLVGVPTIVVPLPYLYKNEQVENALYFKKLGLCKIIYQNNLNEKALLSGIKIILQNYKKQKSLAQMSKEGIVLDGAKKLIQQILIYEKN